MCKWHNTYSCDDFYNMGSMFKNNSSCTMPCNKVKRNVNFTDWELQQKVEHPSHYTWLKDKCGIEVIDIVRHMDFNLGNALKYILRCGKKSEQGYTDKEKMVEDLRKAIFYINDTIEHL